MRPDRVVMAPPAFYDDLGLAQRVEYFAIEQFVAQACVKTLDVSVLPRAAWCDVGSLRTDRCNPCLHGLGDELRPIVGPYMARHATQDEQIGQHVDHVDGLELAAYPDRQAFMGELINHIEHAISPSVMSPVLHKVVGQDVIAVLGPQPNASSVGQPEPTALGLFVRDLEPLPFDPLD